LTGRENVLLNGAILGMTRAEIRRRFDEMVDFSGVEKFLDTPVKRYSSGMRVRLAFAVAAHLEPQILVVDEVLAVGDVDFQKRCLGKMQDVASDGRTVLFVSHNLNAVSQLCSRATLIERGKLMMDGDVQSVVAGYLSAQQDSRSERTVQTWDLGTRKEPVYTEVQANGTALPGEVVVPSEEKLHFVLKGCAQNRLLRHFRAGIHISTRDGVRILSYSTFFSEFPDVNVMGPTSLECVIDSLPLLPGTYYLSIGCADDTGTVDWLEKLALLTVQPNPRVSERRVATYKTHGYFAADCKWRILDGTVA
jgi:lipopolysaccharide transport system ATP-binding protein